MIDLTSRTAIVAGGGRGIGASVARLVARAGANVVVADLGAELNGTGYDAAPAAAVSDEIRAAGGTATYSVCDVGSLTSVQDLFAETLEAFGEVHIVVNVAGNLRNRTIWNMTAEEWGSVMRVHLNGTFNTVSTAARHWKQVDDADSHFRIINFIPAAGLYGSFGQPDYSAAKMGVVGLTYSVAQSWARYGATANMVAPLATTRMVASIPRIRTMFGDSDRMSPDHVAPIVAYLASKRSAWSNGASTTPAARYSRCTGTSTRSRKSRRTVHGISRIWQLRSRPRCCPPSPATPTPSSVSAPSSRTDAVGASRWPGYAGHREAGCSTRR